jgi:RNA polymerase sigma factor (sigma-70 family)
MFCLATPTDISERDLVRQCLLEPLNPARRVGQQMLFDRYKRAMFSVAFRLLNDYDHANDALQDGFLEVFRCLDQFTFRSTLGAWIKTIVVRQALRKQQLERRFVSLNETLYDRPAPPLPDSLTSDELDLAIRNLPAGARAVFLLAEVEGYAHKEIAELLGISEGTSKSQLSYAKKLLRQRLEKP